MNTDRHELAFAWRRWLRLRHRRRRFGWRCRWFRWLRCNRSWLWRGGSFFCCRSGCFFRRSLWIFSFLDQTANRVRRLRAFADPMFDAIKLQGAVLSDLLRIVSADDLDKFP